MQVENYVRKQEEQPKQLNWKCFQEKKSIGFFFHMPEPYRKLIDWHSQAFIIYTPSICMQLYCNTFTFHYYLQTQPFKK